MEQYPEYSDELWAALQRTFSQGRQQYYLNRASHDCRRAFELHEWNTRLSESLYAPLQAFQIVLRNSLDTKITEWHKKDGIAEEWYDSAVADWRTRWCPTPLERGDTCVDLSSHVKQAKKKLKEDQGRNAAGTTFQEPEPHDNFVAAANFGLWVVLLHEHYASTLWKKVLCHGFPDSTNRRELYDFAGKTRDVRNSVMHYEPVFEKGLPELHDGILRHLGSWCPKTADLVAKTSHFKRVWAAPPSWWKNPG
jgi:hypothetical protein